jgi:F-type H+-transporting ATPase subunit epsilon
MTLQVELVSPERVLYSGEATMVLARTVGGGDIAFQTGHAPFIGALATWTVTIYEAGGSQRWAAVHGGFIEVSGDHVKILSDIAELADQIDVERARRAAERSELRAREATDQDALGSLARAHARIRATGGLVDV